MIDALLHREHTSFREIGHRSVAFVLERAGIAYTLDEVRDLVSHIERLRPFPEVPEALARLQTRYPMVVLSNGDPDMLEAAKQHHRIPFDRVISVAVANAFKPHVATYTKAAEIVVFTCTRCCSSQPCVRLHRAKSAGMRTAFIDRRQRPFGITPHQPDLILSTMRDLADALV
jgi:2-haloacid dehalogenase